MLSIKILHVKVWNVYIVWGITDYIFACFLQLIIVFYFENPDSLTCNLLVELGFFTLWQGHFKRL